MSNGDPPQKIDAKVDVTGPWSLSGWPKVVAQLGAAGVISVLLVYAQLNQQELIREIRADNRDEVQQFREELKAQRESDRDSRARQWERIREHTELIKEALKRLK